MTHYRSQLALLKRVLQPLNQNRNRNHQHGSGSSVVELHTADRFQGRDKEVVVLSLVRSNAARSVGDLLRDWRRVNVALTRAKTKLLVVGSRATLRACGGDDEMMLARFVRLVEARGWVFDLPPDALDAHVFPEDAATQVAGRGDSSQGSPAKPSPTTTKQKQKNDKNKSPRKQRCRGTAAAAAGGGGGPVLVEKENNARGLRRSPKKGVLTGGKAALLRNKPVARDILNEMTGGIY
ncbi:AAA domain-containing protein [Xylariomycetidae sp. FL0641]|nr:AAA domain-containing protein [Xylariomycetidae sp. FL0641]